MKVNPKAEIVATAEFTLKKDDGTEVPGRIEGKPTWSSNNPKDKLEQSEDGFSVKVDASANDDGDVTVLTCQGDGNLTPGEGHVSLVTLESEPLEYDVEEELGADGGRIEVTMNVVENPPPEQPIRA